MATDNTPPRLKLIATIAVIVVITLVSLDFMLKSYYGFMTDEAQREKIAPTTAKEEQRAAEQASFAGAKVPIDQAMAQLKGARAELIEPKPSEDLAPMTGWSKLPKPPPLPAPVAPSGIVPAPSDVGDAGASHGGGDAAVVPPVPAPGVAKDAGAAGHPGH